MTKIIFVIYHNQISNYMDDKRSSQSSDNNNIQQIKRAVSNEVNNKLYSSKSQ